jgi:acetyl esterase
MSLDPLVKAFLNQAAMIPRPKMWQLPPGAARASFAGMMGLVGPQNVAVGRVENLSIPVTAGPGSQRQIAARAYAPVAISSEPHAALIFFHGGGFVVGGLDTHDGICRILCAEGNLRVIAVDYRLAPEHPYPAALDDAVAATGWIAANAAQLGIDPGRIAVGGDSAGGMLAAIVAQMARDKGGPALAFQLLMFPNTQMVGERICRGLFPGAPHHQMVQQPVCAERGRPRLAAGLAAAGKRFREAAARLCDAGGV